jgi:hypothetical protein
LGKIIFGLLNRVKNGATIHVLLTSAFKDTHMRRHLLTGMILTMMAVLAGCGSSGNSTPPPSNNNSGPTPGDVANAAGAKVVVVLQADSNQGKVTWNDTFPDESGYHIQQNGTAGWTDVAAVSATAGTGSSVSWSGTFQSTSTIRVVAVKSTYVVPLLSASGSNQLTITPAPQSVAIQMDKSEPVSGTVNLSLSGVAGASSASWFVDLNDLGSNSSSPTFTIPWDASSATNGSHLVLARLATGNDVFLEARKTVNVGNGNLQVSAYLTGTSGTVYLEGTVKADYTLVSVEGFLDGNSLGALTALADCPPKNSGIFCYPFAIDSTKVTYGTHVVKVVAKDSAGHTALASKSIVFDNPPQIVITSPIPGAIIKNDSTLTLNGSFADDTPGTTVKASLGSVQILSTNKSPFSTNFSLKGLASGTYLLTVTAIDSKGQITTFQQSVTVQPDTGFTYTPVVSIQSGALLAAEGNDVLYALTRDPVRDFRLHDAVGNSDVVLDTTDLTAEGQGPAQLSSGHTVMSAVQAGHTQIFAWDSDGTRHNISAAAGTTTGIVQPNDVSPVAHWPWVLWDNQGGTGYVLYNVNTETQNNPGLLPNSETPGTGFDFLDGTTITLFTWGAVSNVVNDIFEWNSGSGNWITMTSSDSFQDQPQTDGTVVAWAKAASLADTTKDLIIAPVSDLTAQQTLSSTLSAFMLRDGLLAWRDTGANTILVYDGTAVTPLSLKVNVRLRAVGGGAVVFEEDGQLYLWSASKGKKLLLGSSPQAVFISGNVIYLSNGSVPPNAPPPPQTIYRVVWQ